MALTLEDVGRQCGVSRSTVSRVINNSPLVNDATKQRVMKAIRELNYAPNFIARSLTRNKTDTLAVTLPDITGGVFPEILAGMDEVASQQGYHLLVVFLGGARPRSTTMEELISHRRADAVLTVASTVDDRELRELAERQLPIVCVAHKSPAKAIPSILFDDAGGAQAAVRHLLSIGRQRIVNLRGPKGTFDADERSRGFRAAMKEAGVAADPAMEVSGDFQREGGAKAVRDLLARKVRFDALFAGNDDMAIGALEALGEKGLSVPGDVCVVGFDDIESARLVGLSTVRAPMRELGRAAARLAFQLVDGAKPAEPKPLAVEFVQRASSTPGATVAPVRISGPARQ